MYQHGFVEEMWGWLALVGIAGTGGQLLMTKAYVIANPGQIGPYSYSAVIYASMMGWFIWNEVLLWTTLLGMGIIIFAGLLTIKKA